MYYHGTAGVQRDMAAAAQLYRLNAEQNPADPIAQYDYAVLHLRVGIPRWRSEVKGHAQFWSGLWS